MIDMAATLLVLSGVGTLSAVIATIPVVWDYYQSKQVKKRRPEQQ